MFKANLAEIESRAEQAEKSTIKLLKSELEKGITSMKCERLYTIEEAWKEIDTI